MTAIPHSIYLAWLLFFFYCFLGWIIECTYCSIPAGHFINRGFLNGPYIPIYGSGAMVGLALFGELTNPIQIFFLGGIMCCILEFVTSWAMEKLYHARWWDYSDKPLNVQGRIWVGGFIEFGLAIVVAVLVVNPPVLKYIERIPRTTAIILAAVTFTIFAIDLIISHNSATKMRDAMDQFVKETRAKAAELATQTREHAEAVAAEAREQTQAAIAETRAQAEAMTEEIREKTERSAETREQVRAAAKQRAESLRERASLRKSLRRSEDWERALDWSMGTYLRSIGVKARERRPNLPQIAALEEASKKMRERLGRQERRMLEAFPGLRPTAYRELPDELASSFEDEAE